MLDWFDSIGSLVGCMVLLLASAAACAQESVDCTERIKLEIYGTQSDDVPRSTTERETFT